MVRVLDGSDPEPVEETRFSDVDGSHRWAAHIERFVELGVTEGYGDGSYRPDVTVSRAQMAAFLARAFELPAAEPAGFVDIDGDFHQDNINRVAAAAITTGCGDGTNYCPNQPTSRSEMAIFISRAIKYTESQEAESVESQETEPSFDPPTKLDVGGSHSCMVRADATIACWGNIEHGQAEAPNGRFKAVSAGAGHSCALRTDDTVVCWGYNGDADRYTGATVAPPGTFKTVATGRNFSCGLRPDRTVECWGDNRYGQSDPPSGRFTSVTTGSWHSFGLR